MCLVISEKDVRKLYIYIYINDNTKYGSIYIYIYIINDLKYVICQTVS